MKKIILICLIVFFVLYNIVMFFAESKSDFSILRETIESQEMEGEEEEFFEEFKDFLQRAETMENRRQTINNIVIIIFILAAAGDIVMEKRKNKKIAERTKNMSEQEKENYLKQLKKKSFKKSLIMYGVVIMVFAVFVLVIILSG